MDQHNALYGEGHPDATRSFVLFDALLSDWAPTIARLDHQLGLSIMREVRIRHLQAVDQLIDPGLRRSHETWEAIEAPKQLIELADRVWADILSLAGETEAAETFSIVSIPPVRTMSAHMPTPRPSPTRPSSPPDGQVKRGRRPPAMAAIAPIPSETAIPVNKNLVGRGLRSLPDGKEATGPRGDSRTASPQVQLRS